MAKLSNPKRDNVTPLPPTKCSICDGPIDIHTNGWKYGHNAQPVNNGRCCTDCNNTVVIPTRLAGLRKRKPITRAVNTGAYPMPDGQWYWRIENWIGDDLDSTDYIGPYPTKEAAQTGRKTDK